MRFLKGPIGHIFSGFIVWLPIAVAILAGSLIFGNLEQTGKSFLHLFFPEESVHAGFGILLWLLIFYLSGLILKITPAGDYLAKIPLLGLFFRRRGAAITLDKLFSMPPCLFLYSPTCPSYGWILGEQNVTIDDRNSTLDLITVYYPNVPTLVTGQVYSVRKETVMKLGNPSREIVDILLYGFRQPKVIEYIPWEGEGEEEFARRAERFGIS